MENKKQILSMQLNVDDFAPASDSEKESLSVMRESVSFWKDGLRRLRKNPIAMVSLAVLIIVLILAFIVPAFYPYDYATQIRGSENLGPMQYSEAEQAAMAAGEKVFPHILGTDSLGRDYAVRVMMGTRVSLSVGLLASVLVLLIGSVYGSVAGFLGGKVDLFMMRIVDIIYTVPEHIHGAESPGLCIEFLAIDSHLATGYLLVRFQQQTATAAGGIVDSVVLFWLYQRGYQLRNLAWREELASLLSGIRGEHSNHVLVGISDDIGRAQLTGTQIQTVEILQQVAQGSVLLFGFTKIHLGVEVNGPEYIA